MSDVTDLRRRIEAALMQHAKADDELQAKIADKEGGRIVFDIEELAGVPDLEALLLDCLPFLSAPAVPDDVAGIVAELRVIGCHENGDARCTCGIGMDAADALEAQAAELARYRAVLEVVAEGDSKDYTDNYELARAALTHPTGD